MNLEKKIVITGKTNRYQMNKVLKIVFPCAKKDSEKMDSSFYDFEYQRKMLEEETSECYQEMKKEIAKKLNGYKHQDDMKKRTLTDPYSTSEIMNVLQKEMGCYYCKEKMLVLYENKREKTQWTLDRIDNDLGHNKTNVVVSCLQCNMEKRRRDNDKFLYSKNIKLIKVTPEDEDLGFCLFPMTV
jgi:hypothetical protein